MLKKILSIICFFACCVCVNAQKQLVINDVSSFADVHPSKEKKEFKAVFKCNKQLKLSFVSNYHKNGKIDILSETVDTVGNQLVYELVFPTELVGAGALDGRVLSVYADGFDRYDMVRFNFPVHTKKVFEVEDPYEQLQNPYYLALSKASEYFAQGNYDDARTQYEIAQKTPEYESDKQSIDDNIQLIDSIKNMIVQADKAFADIKYMEAMELYRDILKLNPGDAYVISKAQECVTAHGNNCTSFYNMAEEMYNEGDFETAKEYYNKVIDADCSFSSMATTKLLMVERKLKTKKFKARFFTYEFHKDAPIGFTVGKCNNRGSGGFFSLRINTNTLELMRNEPSVDLVPEANVSFGWTHKIVAPVWFFIGPGYTGVGTYKIRESAVDKDVESLGNKDYSFKWHSAISPEAGIIVKLWHFNIKYSFQYRYALKSADEDLIDEMRHYVGIGFCW